MNKALSCLSTKTQRCSFTTLSRKHFEIGEIPENLKYDRPYCKNKTNLNIRFYFKKCLLLVVLNTLEETILPNGIKVCSESWPSPICT